LNTWPLFEVFIRSKNGLDHKHVGSLHATDAKMAIENARDSDTFCGGMAQLWGGVKDRGANLIGQVSTDDYTFDDSEAVADGKFIGLALDEVNEADKTDERIAGWMEQIKKLLK
jgi:phenylacetate-CoA oxygenase PaaH subunit